MQVSRLSQALENAGGLPSAGRILVLRPTPNSDLTLVPRERAVVSTGFFPDFDAFASRGYSVLKRPEGAFSSAVIFIPRAKLLAKALVAEAANVVTPGGPIWVDGQKTDGIDALYREVSSRVTVEQSFAKAHGRAFMFAGPGRGVFDDWQPLEHEAAPGFITRPGVFSADGIDPGSALLAAHLPKDLKGKGADLGAGWGWLSAQVLSQTGVKELHLVEAEADALSCAQLNVKDERAVFHWTDATRFHPGKALDFVVMNPPFHLGRAADPSLGAGFIRAAAKMLQPSGRLLIVANRSLPYEETLGAAFMTVTRLAHSNGFKVLLAARPVFKRKL